MKVAFAGTPEFAHVALSRLLDTAHHVALVLTQPDRPAGRGLKLLPGPVKQAAQAAGISVIQPRSLRLDGKYPQDAQDAQQALLALQPDVMIVAAYGLILPKWVLDLPAYGCLNIHASLLPRWRGAAPIQRAIEAGDAQTGVCIMQMDEGLDTGDIVRRAALPITPRHTAARLHDELAELGAQVLLETLDDLSAKGRLPAQPQATTGITYAAKLSKTEATLDWALPAEVLERRIRAFNPVPGASATLPGLKDAIKIWQAQALPEHDPKRKPRPAGVLQIDQTALTTNQSASLAVYGEVKRGHCNMEPKAPLTCGEEAPTPRSEFFTPAVPGKVLSVSPKGIDIATGAGILRLLILQKAGGKRLPVADFVHGWDGCCDRHG